MQFSLELLSSIYTNIRLSHWDRENLREFFDISQALLPHRNTVLPLLDRLQEENLLVGADLDGLEVLANLAGQHDLNGIFSDTVFETLTALRNEFKYTIPIYKYDTIPELPENFAEFIHKISSNFNIIYFNDQGI